MSYRERLFEKYHATHARYLDVDSEKTRWFDEHVRQNYLAKLPSPTDAPRILELGCGKGFMLATLKRAGFSALTGVDLSHEDIDQARRRLPGTDLQLFDAIAFLRAHPSSFEVIIAKAVLEHQEKASVVPLLEAIRDSLRPGGRALLEVPNMDWLMAPHERYMDFTHEVGFTRESLAQVLRLVYGNGDVYPMTDAVPVHGLAAVRRRVLRATATTIVALLLRGLGHNAHETLWDARSILGVAFRNGAVNES